MSIIGTQIAPIMPTQGRRHGTPAKRELQNTTEMVDASLLLLRNPGLFRGSFLVMVGGVLVGFGQHKEICLAEEISGDRQGSWRSFLAEAVGEADCRVTGQVRDRQIDSVAAGIGIDFLEHLGHFAHEERPRTLSAEIVDGGYESARPECAGPSST